MEGRQEKVQEISLYLCNQAIVNKWKYIEKFHDDYSLNSCQKFGITDSGRCATLCCKVCCTVLQHTSKYLFLDKQIKICYNNQTCYRNVFCTKFTVNIYCDFQGFGGNTN